MKLLIVVPCYNEEEVLRATTLRLNEILGNLEEKSGIESGKILYVDDGSKDATWSLIQKLSAENTRVCGVKLAHNVGHQQALWAGLETGVQRAFDALVSIDADLQDDVHAIPEMVDRFREGYEVVYGVRKERTTDTWMKRNTALGFYKLMSALGGEIVYNHADFRLMSLRAVRALMAYPERNLFLRGMVPTLGYRSTSVYYNRQERFAGESKYPFRKMMSFAIDGITSFSVRPLRLITSLGFFCLFIAVGAIVYALLSFVRGTVIPGWTSLLISLWFLGGALLIAIGILGEYVGKIYKEVKQRPRYFIEEEV